MERLTASRTAGTRLTRRGHALSRTLSTTLALTLLGSWATALGSGSGASTCLWHDRSPASITRAECASVTYQGKLYNFSGFHGLDLVPSVSCEVYDPATDAWSPIADSPVAFTHAGYAEDGNGTVWIVGGFIGPHPGTVTDETWLYDIATDTWSPGPALPEPRGSGALVRFGRFMHYFGGVLDDRNTDSPSHWAIDLDGPLPLEWEPRAPLITPRNHASAAAVGDYIYSIGGQFRHDVLPQDIDVVDRYDPDTDTWDTVSNLPFPRSHFEPGTFVMDGQIVIVGGRSNTTGRESLSDVTAYDPATDTWTPLTPLKTSLFAPSATAVNGEIFVVGGFSPDGPLADTIAHDPTEPWSGELRFSAGGQTSYVDANGDVWCPDQLSENGQAFRTQAFVDILGTDEDELYMTERSGSNSLNDRFTYRLPVTSGPHLVRLHFAEIWWGAPKGGTGGVGSRVFDVLAEGELVLDDLDIFAEVGPITALVKSFELDVADGVLDLEFISSADRPKVSGIEVIPLSSPTPERYCTSALNSTGVAATMGWSGTSSLAASDLVLRADGLPPTTTGLFAYAPARTEVPLGNGTLCIAPGSLGFVARLSGEMADSGGRMEHALDASSPPTELATILPGSTWHFTCWFRDNAAPAPRFNFADGLTVVFRP